MWEQVETSDLRFWMRSPILCRSPRIPHPPLFSCPSRGIPDRFRSSTVEYELWRCLAMHTTAAHTSPSGVDLSSSHGPPGCAGISVKWEICLNQKKSRNISIGTHWARGAGAAAGWALASVPLLPGSKLFHHVAAPQSCYHHLCPRLFHLTATYVSL